ncbi:hypothetical protein [Microaceticoccus formicicus]|uniref:hypothetical protein n=1 Tax=Microaceticoccus formicicus TaxID=3118105 RepID=UPI003CD018CE|nr:hypothetical protein VZL98_09430 [Peptoniphilaceae bacterium AMB_02]
MKNKKISIKSLYALNILVLLTFSISIYLMSAKLKFWYVALVLLVLSVFETRLYFQKSNKTFQPLPNEIVIDIILKSVGLTVVTIGSILLIIALFLRIR